MKKTALLLLLTMLGLAGKMSAQLSGVKTIPGDYASLTLAITDLNTQGVAPGGVVFQLLPGNPQTAPAGGYQITTNTSSATNPVAFIGNGNTITASNAHTVGDLTDAVFKIIGADNIGIQGFIIQENPANVVNTPAAGNTMTEWGIALLYQSTTNGAQGCVILGNTISLSRAYANTWGIYSNTRHSATAVGTTADATSPAGANSNNSVLQNSISNVNMGIAFIGASTSANSDLNNVIGSGTMGNTITNWGGAAALSGYISNTGTSYCIFMNHQINSTVRGNVISTTASPTVTFRGIVQDYTAAGPTVAADNKICQNTITMVSSQASGTFAAIVAQGGTNSETMTLDSNLIQNCALTGVGNSSTLVGISVANPLGALNVRYNRIGGNTSTATTGGFSGITVTSVMGGTCDINHNSIGSAAIDAITFSAATSGAVVGISFSGSGGAVSLRITDNTFHGFVFSATATAVVDVIRHTGAIGTSVLNNNVFDNLSFNTTGAITVINNPMVGSATSIVTISGNVIAGALSKTATGGSGLTVISGTGASVAGASRRIQNNVLPNVSTINSTINGITETGGATAGAINRQITGNTMNGWSSSGGILFISVDRTGTGSVISNNMISGCTSTSNAAQGISVAVNCTNDLGIYSNTFSNFTAVNVTFIRILLSFYTGSGLDIANNVLFGATTTGPLVAISTIAQGPIKIHDNTIYDLNSSAPATNGAFGISGSFVTSGNSIQSNKIFDLENTSTNGLATGIVVTGATSVTINNNLIGDIRTPNSTTGNTVKGIDIQSTSGACVASFNTVYLSGTSTGSGFGSSCINANTGGNLTLRNNLFVNNCTPTGTGLAVANMRSSVTLSTLLPATDHNCYYAGTPSANHLIYYDGTNSDQTITAYKARLGPGREATSVTENPAFSSIVGLAPDFLHIPAATVSLLESGGINIPGVAIDWDTDVRPGPTGSVNGGAILPDIGADEFDGILATCSGTPTGGTASTSSPASQCPGNVFNLLLTGHSTGTPFTYQWQESVTNGGPYTNIPGATSTTYTTTALSSTMYYVCVVTCTVSGLSATSTQVTATINPNPVLSFAPTAPALCAGGAPVNVVVSGANTYAWSPATGLSSSTINNPDANPAATTTYTVVGTSVDGCTSSETVTVTVNPLPSIAASASPAAVCAGSTTTLTATGGSTYIWAPLSTSGSSVTDAPVVATTYTVTGTDVNGCTNNATVSVSVAATPTVTASANVATVCDGSPVTLTGTGASTYSWNPGSISGSPVVVNPAVSTSYTVTGTAVNGCTATDMVSITVNPLPTVSAGAVPSVICFGDAVSLSGSGASSYNWMPGSLSGSSVVDNPAATTTYTLTGTDVNGCTGTDNVTVTVNPLPVVIATATPSSICAGDASSLSATGANGYLWLPGSMVGTPVSVSPGATTTYTVTGTDVAGCSSNATVTVTVNPLPTILASSTPSAICAGDNTTLNASGGSSYLWMPGSLSGASVADAPVATTTYTVTATDVNGCTGSDVTTVTVNPAPSVGVSATTTTICQGSFSLLTATGAVSYTWMPGSLSGANIVVSPAATTTYTVTGTGASGCTSTATITINVNPVPVVSITGPAAYCQGGSALLSSSAGATYQWYLNGSQVFGATSQTYAATAPGIYNVMVATAAGCSDSAAIGFTLIENPTPVVTFTAAPSLTVCTGTSVTLTGAGATSYAWSGGITNATPFTPLTSGSYTVTGTDVNGCTNTAVASVVVNALPVVTASATPSSTICAGSSVAVSGTGASTYSWTGGVTDGVPFIGSATTTYTVTGTDVNGCTGTGTITVTVNPLPLVGTTASPAATICAGSSVTLNGTNASTYTWSGGVINGVAFTPVSTAGYTVTGTDANGCVNTASITVTVNPAPTVSFTASPGTAVCTGTAVTLSGTGATSYAWSGGVTNGVAFIPAATTTYTVTGTNASGCTNTATVTITVNPLPTVGSTAAPSSTVCAGGSLTLNGTGAVSYTWSGGVTNGVSFAPPSTTTYTVTGTDVNGCTGTSNILVTVNPSPTVGATASPGSSVCAGTSVTLNGSGASSYTWSGGVTNGVAFVPASTTSYVVVGTNAAGCTNSATITITVNPLPTVTASVSPSGAVCNGTMVTLTGGGATSYTWSGGVTNGVPFAATATTTYTVTGTDVNGCINTATRTVTVNPIPTVSSTANPSSTVCSGTLVTLNGTGATTYTWTGGVTNGVPFAAVATTTYTVTGTDAIGCSNTSTVTVTVNPLPSVSSTATPAAAICAGSSVTLNGTGATTYTWSGGVTNGVPFSPASTTTYTVTGTNANGCTNTATRTITVNPTPVITSAASPATTVCAGTMVTLNGIGGSTYAWSGGVTNNVPFAASTTTTYTVTGTNASGCTSTSTITITVNPAPNINCVQSPAGPVCAGNSVTLNGIGGISYTWTGGVTDGVPFVPLATTTYTVTGTGFTGCTNTQTITVTVNPRPTVSSTASPATTVCAGTAVTLNGTGALTYTWTGGVTNNVAFTPVATNTYTVTGTAANGCTNTATTVVTVNPLPVIASTTTPSSAVCAGTSVTLSGTGAVTYTWSGGVTNAVAFVPVATTTYTVTGTGANGCTATAVTTVTVNPLPVVSTSVTPAPNVCSGTLVTLNGSGASTYVWSGGVTDNVPFVAATTTTYTVTGTAVTGCTNTATTTVNVTPSPVISYNASPGINICNGTELTLDGTGAVTYSWSDGIVDGNPFTPLVTDTFTVVGTDGNGCVDSATVIITVNAPPVISANVSPSDTVCENQLITLTGIGAATYTWSHGVTNNSAFGATVTTTYTVVGTDGNGCSDTTTQTVEVIAAPVVAITGNSSFCTGGNSMLTSSPGALYQWYLNGTPIVGATSATYTATIAGVYNVWVTNAAGCGDSSATGVNMSINAPPTVIANATATSVCRGTAVTLTGSGAVSYSWSAGVNNGLPFTPINTVTYTVVGTSSNGCTDTDTISVVVNALPSVAASAVPGFAVCENTPVILSGSGAATYSWTGGLTDGVAFTPVATSTYTVTGTDMNGCTNTASVTVTVNPLPVVDLGPDSALCGSITLDAGNAGAMYNWSTSDTTQTINAMVSGTYMVDVTTAFGCTSSDTVVLTINAQPVVALGADDTLCAASVTLDAMNPGATYVWNDFSTAQTNVATVSGTYFVTATMPGGCSSSDTINLVLNTPPNVTLSLPVDTACLNMGSLTLSGESPAGGIWSGPAVSGSTFDPMIAGVGTFGITYQYTDTNGCSGTVVDSILVDPCLGIETQSAGIDFSMYPNPNNGDFNILLNESANVLIYNAAGQIVYSEQVSGGVATPISLEVSGMYMVTVVMEDGAQMTKRVVVNR